MLAGKKRKVRNREAQTEPADVSTETSAQTTRIAQGGAGLARGAQLKRLPIQTKLTVGRPNDRFEQEADRVADKVSNGQAAPDVSRIPPGGLRAQRAPEDETGESSTQSAADETDSAQSTDNQNTDSAQGEAENDSSGESAQTQAESTGDDESGAAGQTQTDGAAGDNAGDDAQTGAEPSAGENDTAAQARADKSSDGKKEPAQTAGDTADDKAQEKCDACEAEEAGQKKDDHGESAQGATVEGEGAQTSAATSEETASGPSVQTTSGDEEGQTAQLAEDDSDADEDVDEPQSDASDEDAQAPECDDAAVGGGGGEAEAETESEGSQEAEEGEEASADESAGEAETANEELGCGEGGGGEGAEPAAGEGGASCAATGEDAAVAEVDGGEASGATEGGEESPAAEPEQQPGEGAVPSCAEPVDAAPETEGEGESGGQGGEGECAQTQADDEASGEGMEADASQTRADDESSQASADGEDGQTETDDKAAQSSEEGDDAQAKREEDAQTGGDDTASADDAQTKCRDDTQTAAEDDSAGGEAAQTAAEEKEDGQTRSASRRRVQRPEEADRLIRSRGAGDPLRPEVRERIEHTVGVDLNDVRVHTGGTAQAANKALKSKAFTVGQHIWLGQGQSSTDVNLLAHESTHVLQQGAVERRAPAAPPHRTAASEGSQDTETGPGKAPVGDEVPAGVAAVDSAESAEEEIADQTDSAGAAETRERDAAGPDAPDGKGGKAAGTVVAKGRKGEGTAAAGALDRVKAVIRRIGRVARREKSHTPAGQKVGEARGAAVAPRNERASRAQAGQVEVMAAQEAKKPRTDDFLSLLRAAIARIAPKNLDESDKFKKSGKVATVKSSLTGQVAARKNEASSGIAAATQAEPDASTIPEQPAVPMPAEKPVRRSRSVNAAGALPAPKSDAAVSAAANKRKAESVMRENDIDEAQLERANEPEFSDTLAAKQKLGEDADAMPERYRETEQAELESRRAELGEQEAADLGGMRRARSAGLGSVRAKQGELKKRDEAERQEVANTIENLYASTRKKVEDRLGELDSKVDKKFDTGERIARERFENYVDRRMRAYKFDRYLNRLGGSVLWAKDKLFGMPDEVNAFYVEGREGYLADMDEVIVEIADLVETELKAAKDDIANGKKEIATYIKGLPAKLQAAGKEAQRNVASRFDQLEASVEEKKQDLANRVAQKVQDARNKLDERIAELKAANQGLVDGFIGKIKKIIRLLREFKNRVMGLLSQAGDVIRAIVKDPIGFLKNMLKAVKQGFQNFVDNIGTHLKRGLIGWMFGTLQDAGITVPSEFSAKAVFGLVAQVLGITAQNIKRRLGRLIGARNVERLSATVSFVSALVTEGPAKLWDMVQAKLGSLKEKVMDAVKDWVIGKIIKQAVLWLLSLFNPVAALLKAIKAIYDLIMFFVENIERILQVVQTVLKSAALIVAGNIASAAKWIEKSLAGTVPIVIGFLARLLGLSGLGDKIRKVIKKLRAPINRAIDAALKKVVGMVKKFLGAGKRAGGKAVAGLKKFLFPQRRFRAGKSSHRLFFKGKGTSARLMMASQTEDLKNLLSGLKSQQRNKSGANRKALGKVSTAIDKIEEAKKGISKNEGKAQAEINKQLAIIAKELPPVLEGGDFASEQNPLSLEYPKRASAEYEPVLVGPKVGTGAPRIVQDTLREASTNQQKKNALAKGLSEPVRKAWKARGMNIETFTPHAQKSLPEGGDTIGLSSDYYVHVGKKLMLPGTKRTPGGGKINKALAPYGYSARKQGWDGDHVVEIQLGGKDRLENLWPLEKGENRGAGSTLASKTFTKPDGSKTSMKKLKKLADANQQIWLTIVKTKAV